MERGFAVNEDAGSSNLSPGAEQRDLEDHSSVKHFSHKETFVGSNPTPATGLGTLGRPSRKRRFLAGKLQKLGSSHFRCSFRV